MGTITTFSNGEHRVSSNTGRNINRNDSSRRLPQSRWVRHPFSVGGGHVIRIAVSTKLCLSSLPESLKRPQLTLQTHHLNPLVRHVSTFRSVRHCSLWRKILLSRGGLLCWVEDDASRLTDLTSFRIHNGSPSCSLLPLLQE